MKLSIFSAANPHPKSKEEKNEEAFKFSFPYLPEVAEFHNEDNLIELVTNNCWSPFIFSGKRHADNFVSCDVLTYDIDEGLSIEDAQATVEKLGLACLCLPSPSHTEEAHRFRIILPLSRTIFSEDVYVASWLSGAKIFGVVDEQCKDLARAYFGSTMEDGFWNEGDLFEPVEPAPVKESDCRVHNNNVLLPVGNDIGDIVSCIYGEERKVVPEAVDFFIRNAHTGLPGQWINALNRFCFSLALSGVRKDAILKVCEELAPSELDKKDMYQITRAINDAEKALEQEV